MEGMEGTLGLGKVLRGHSRVFEERGHLLALGRKKARRKTMKA